MVRTISLVMGSLSVAAAPTAALAGTFGTGLRLTVAVNCSVQHEASGYGAASADGVILGRIQEYCNAPGGYELVVSYKPGSMQGAKLTAGDDQVVLNGSGQAVLSRAPGPRMRERIVSATPGEQGFDTDRLEFQIMPV